MSCSLRDMQKRSSIKKRSVKGVSKLNARVVEAVDDKVAPVNARKNPAAVALGRLGGLKGGKARAEKLTPKQRIAIAKQAARARWGIRESE
ncbi:MAG TPA: hypothetical protein VFM05_00945 [Candidatus Saccharimonadales bacterium]|nr:hypothetical protein [Candidatus Saccharimonadales bacterium]